MLGVDAKNGIPANLNEKCETKGLSGTSCLEVNVPQSI